jgi:heme-degrading monooxygenase HmoA
MSVYMSLRVKADPARLEQVARDNPDTLLAIAERAKGQGAIHHTFAAADGEVVVMDEWESEEAFQRFFESDPEVPKLMEQAGASGAPEISFYRPLRLGDDF